MFRTAFRVLYQPRALNGFRYIGWCDQRRLLAQSNQLRQSSTRGTQFIHKSRLSKRIKRELTPEQITSNKTFQQICDQGSLAEAKEYFESARRKNLADIMTYSLMINLLCKNNDVPAAYRLFHTMHDEKKVTPNVVIYSTLISAYAAAKNFLKMENLFAMLKNKGVMPDTDVFGIMMNAYAKDKKRERVMQLHNEMKKKNLDHNINVLCALMLVYSSNAQEGRKFLQKCLSKTRSLDDKQRLFASYLNSLREEPVELRYIDEVVEDMKLQSVPMDKDIARALFNIYAAANSEERILSLKAKGFLFLHPVATVKQFSKDVLSYTDQQALEYANQLAEDNVQHAVQYYYARVSESFLANKGEVAWSLLQLACKQADCKFLNIDLYNHMLSKYIDRKDYTKARKIHPLVRDEAHPAVVPNTCTYNLLIKLYGEIKDITAMEGAYHEMKQLGIARDEYSLHPMLTAYSYMSNNDYSDKALLILQEMEAISISPSIHTYNSLIRCFVHAQKWADTINIIQKLRKSRVAFNQHTYVCIAKLLIGMHKLTRLALSSFDGWHQLFPDYYYLLPVPMGAYKQSLLCLRNQALQEKQCSTTLCNMILHYLSQAADTTALPEMKKFMMTNAIPLNAISYSHLISGYLQAEDLAAAEAEINAMPGEGVKPTCDNYVLFIRSFAIKKERNLALEWYQRMKSALPRSTQFPPMVYKLVKNAKPTLPGTHVGLPK